MGSVGYAVKHFATLVGSMINWFSGNNAEITDFNIGSRIRTLMEAVAIEIEQFYYQLYQAITNGITNAVYNSFNFPPLQAKASSGAVTFTSSSPAPSGGITIPSGTQLSTQGSSTTPAVIFQTVSTAVIPAGQTSVSVAVIAVVNGSIGNVGQNTIIVLISNPSGISTVTNPVAFSNGADLETADQQAARFQNYIENLSRATLGAIENAALQVANVVAAVAFDSPTLSVFVYSTLTQAFTDISFDMNVPSGTPDSSLPNTTAVNDALYIGSSGVFTALAIDIQTPMAGGSFLWEYWSGVQQAWVTLPLTSDSTFFLSQSGYLTFNRPSDWRDTMVNGTQKFYVRLRVTNNVLSNVATLLSISATPFPGIVYLVAMDASNSLSPTLQGAVIAAVDSYRAAGIRISVFPPVVTKVNVTLTVIIDETADPDTIQTLVTQGITGYLASFALGQSFVLDQMIQFIMNLSTDIVDLNISLPTENMVVSFDEIITPGAINVAISQ